MDTLVTAGFTLACLGVAVAIAAAVQYAADFHRRGLNRLRAHRQENTR